MGIWKPKKQYTKADMRAAAELATGDAFRSLADTVIVVKRSEKLHFDKIAPILTRYNITILTPGEARKANLSQLVKRDASN